MAKNCGEWGRDKAKERYALGGAAFEGSKKDADEDKKIAKAAGMSMKTWEKSSMDKAHDRKGGK